MAHTPSNQTHEKLIMDLRYDHYDSYSYLKLGPAELGYKGIAAFRGRRKKTLCRRRQVW